MVDVRSRCRDEEAGNTLIELMAVLLILGVILAIAVPDLLAAQAKAKSRAASSNLRAALSAARTVYVENSTYAAPTVDASALRSFEPSLRWAATSSGPDTVGFVASSPSQFLMTVKSKNGDCFFLKDDVSTAAASAGPWYGRINGVAGACVPAAALTNPTNPYARHSSIGWK